MKNKLLWYLLWLLLIVFIWIPSTNIYANDDDVSEFAKGKQNANTQGEGNGNKSNNEWTQWKTWWCWSVPAWQYCCDWIVSNVPCDAVVITPEKKACPWWCCWIKLNTNFPIIWNCIWGKGKTDSTTAFPTMIWALTKIVMSLVLVACFILIIYAGILWSADKPKEAKERLKRVAITILLLWFSGVILRLINPNFFS